MKVDDRPMFPAHERKLLRPPRTADELVGEAALVSEWAADVARRSARAIARIASALKRRARRRGETKRKA